MKLNIKIIFGMATLLLGLTACAEEPFVPEYVSPMNNMVLVEGDTFLMGDWLPNYVLSSNISDMNIKDQTAYNEHGLDLTFDATNQHWITLDNFYICKYEVTFEEIDRFCYEMKGKINWDGFSGNSDVGPVSWGRGNMPAIYVDWLMACEFCNWLSYKDGLEPCYEFNTSDVIWNTNANGYRLPTEAEWEYAARGGTNISAINSGNGYLYSGSPELESGQDTYTNINQTEGLYADLLDYSWFNITSGWVHSEELSDRNGQSHPVGTKLSNILGLHDMAGNVWEWCWDWYSPNYYTTCIEEGITVNPTGPDPNNRLGDFEITKAHVMRGGSWGNWPIFLRTTFRFFSDKQATMAKYNPSYQYSNWRTGMRLARNAD